MKNAIIALMGVVAAALMGVVYLIGSHHLHVNPQPVHTPPPDMQCLGGQKIYLNGHKVNWDFCNDLDIILDTGMASCPASKQAALKDNWTHIVIQVEDDNFPCPDSNFGCHGLEVGNVLEVASPQVIVDEAGHIVWETCFGGTGEKLGKTADGGPIPIPSPDFSKWCSLLYPAMK